MKGISTTPSGGCGGGSYGGRSSCGNSDNDSSDSCGKISRNAARLLVLLVVVIVFSCRYRSSGANTTVIHKMRVLGPVTLVKVRAAQQRYIKFSCRSSSKLTVVTIAGLAVTANSGE